MLDPLFNSQWLNNLLTFRWFQFIFILLTTILATTKITLQSAACRKHIRNSQDSILYNTLFFASVALFLSLTLTMGNPNAEILLWAFMIAAMTVMFQVMYSIALAEGPVSITVLIINFSVVLPTIISAIVFKERIFISQIIGLACLLISFPLSMKESHDGEKKASGKWFIITIITLIANSLGTTLVKLFKLTDSYINQPQGTDFASNTLLLFIYIFGSSLALTVYYFRRMFGSKEHGANKHTFRLGKSVLLFASGMGLVLAVYQKCNITANMKIDGSILFPTYSGLSSVIMTAVGIILFGDRLNKRQWLGIIFGIFAVVLLNIKFGVSFALC